MTDASRVTIKILDKEYQVGCSPEERAALLKLTNIVRLSLGPRIRRADTAAVAALALIQAALGDWR